MYHGIDCTLHDHQPLMFFGGSVIQFQDTSRLKTQGHVPFAPDLQEGCQQLLIMGLLYKEHRFSNLNRPSNSLIPPSQNLPSIQQGDIKIALSN